MSRREGARVIEIFCHSPESWKELWEMDVFGEGKVKVEASFVEVNRGDFPGSDNLHMMVWTVTRL